MSAPIPTPDERTLREFLLGALAPERIDLVQTWMEHEPSAIEVLQRHETQDLLTAALADTATVEPITSPSVERILHGVHLALHSAATASPEKLGGYRVVREIGRGGMGVVYEAEDERLGRRVALKVLSPERASNPEAKARLLREARAAAGIEHENVVPLHHADEDRGTLFLVMPLLQGESLHARLKREDRLPPTEVIRLGREIASGLAAAHAHGVGHRDIKPANIWLDADTGRARILDFGVAQAENRVDGLTVPGTIQGTPEYMAPEQVEGGPTDPRTDLFSLGGTLYRCVTGQPPFTGASVTAVLRAVTDRDPIPPTQLDSAVPAALSELILRLMSKQPSGRPGSARATVEELAALAAGPSESQPTASWSGRRVLPSRARSRTHAVLVAVVGVAACLALVGLAYFFRLPASPTRVGDTGSPLPLQGSVDVLVWRRGKEKQPALHLNDPRAIPTEAGDWMRIESQLNRPAYQYLVWLDTTGTLTPLYPWKLMTWTEREKERPLARLEIPTAADDGSPQKAPLEGGPPGIETILLLVRETPLPLDFDLKAMFGPVPRQDLDGYQGVVWLENGDVVKSDVTRGPIQLGKSKPIEDVLAHTRAVLRARGRDVFPLTRAVCFPRVEVGR